MGGMSKDFGDLQLQLFWLSCRSLPCELMTGSLGPTSVVSSDPNDRILDDLTDSL